MDKLAKGCLRAAVLMPLEGLRKSWGHGWEEIWYEAEEDEPEGIVLSECVWIDGYIVLIDGCNGDAWSEWWEERYGRRYGVRVWAGDEPPTEEQRKETPWGEPR